MLTLGADVEVFAKNKVGQHIALCGKIGGTKEKPKQLENLPDGFMVQEDNVSLEFNIPPASNRLSFTQNIQAMRKQVENILKLMDLDTSTNASVSFDTMELTHPNALVFGCEPDYNAWTKKENKKPHSKDETLRTCGGHVHFGTDFDMVEGVRRCDLYYGIPSILLDDNPSSVKRRELYGKAGAMRPKPYGFEYRVLSNFWIFSKELCDWVFNSAVDIVDPHSGLVINSSEGEKIQSCINNSDKTLAIEFINKYKIPMPKGFNYAT